MARSGATPGQTLSQMELAQLDAVAIAAQNEEYMVNMFTRWKFNAKINPNYILDFQLYTARFIHDHAGWIIVNDTRPVIDTLSKIIANSALLTNSFAKEILSNILKGTIGGSGHQVLEAQDYESAIATTTTIVEKLWLQGHITISQAQQWLFFQFWMRMERELEKVITFSPSQLSFPESWPICIEEKSREAKGNSFRESSTSNYFEKSLDQGKIELPPFSALFAKVEGKGGVDFSRQNQMPLVASAATCIVDRLAGAAFENRTPCKESEAINAPYENSPEKTADIDTADHDISQISERNSPALSITDDQSCRLRISSRSQLSPAGTKKPSPSIIVTRSRHQKEKDKEIQKSQPPEAAKRKRPTKPVLCSDSRKRPQKSKVVIKKEPQILITAERSGPGFSKECPFAIDD
ncbi:hypothetical protein AOL_s00091g57 [Orbilia oligospora ATCC 24927]|uniref:Uncharacterized protein n=1 Tax=Arthrobotrys oligospora (strain ATCC 24927 / CBS 115.81 / DSM 1491) TaxID=756982 RepID=G1XI05_ARTOA|nr:hypothetical protein AOL_s00091g57 [Orbilia oligospora ATCC 24927]EGX47236.1 hypothetical protein AOL_s00091g57 [Orbilia oligospora ATCC 24927]